jgi:hypothetical protein
VVNTIQKMAQKRALVAATLISTSASEFFTQDVEDADPFGHNIDTGSHSPGIRACKYSGKSFLSRIFVDWVAGREEKVQGKETAGGVPLGVRLIRSARQTTTSSFIRGDYAGATRVPTPGGNTKRQKRKKANRFRYIAFV